MSDKKLQYIRDILRNNTYGQHSATYQLLESQLNKLTTTALFDLLMLISYKEDEAILRERNTTR